MRESVDTGHGPCFNALMFWTRKEKGARGEELAAGFLKRNGYKVIERNYTVDGGEIDIIAVEKDSDTICFVEVKYRSSDEHGLPVEAVNRTK
ncbi:MAG: YraN family protein, partial [Planctomycetota bacterium]|nr:YraN family protein [Planctomycetota bacterium]